MSDACTDVFRTLWVCVILWASQQLQDRWDQGISGHMLATVSSDVGTLPVSMLQRQIVSGSI